MDQLYAAFEIVIHLDDILNKGLALTATKSTDGPGYEAALTISLRRPPQVTIDFHDRPILGKRGRDQFDCFHRRSTEMDWCCEGGNESYAGPVTALPTTGQRANLQLNVSDGLEIAFILDSQILYHSTSLANGFRSGSFSIYGKVDLPRCAMQ
ncbi:hypothetical protein FRC02_010890 [Tulasnella sp. 418]|nr:hypothetical protein FRC02_010890 [Tulasnella sp. 418]